MLSLTTVQVEQRSDPARFRIADTPVSYGDPTRIHEATGWEPRIPFEQTVADLLDYWRNQLKNEKEPKA